MSALTTGKARKGTAVLLCAILVLMLVVSAACLAGHSHHGCRDAGCRICESVRRCGEILYALGQVPAASAVLPMFFAGALSGGAQCLVPSTLAAQSIRMND